MSGGKKDDKPGTSKKKEIDTDGDSSTSIGKEDDKYESKQTKVLHFCF